MQEPEAFPSTRPFKIYAGKWRDTYSDMISPQPTKSGSTFSGLVE